MNILGTSNIGGDVTSKSIHFTINDSDKITLLSDRNLSGSINIAKSGVQNTDDGKPKE